MQKQWEKIQRSCHITSICVQKRQTITAHRTISTSCLVAHTNLCKENDKSVVFRTFSSYIFAFFFRPLRAYIRHRHVRIQKGKSTCNLCVWMVEREDLTAFYRCYCCCCFYNPQTLAATNDDVGREQTNCIVARTHMHIVCNPTAACEEKKQKKRKEL